MRAIVRLNFIQGRTDKLSAVVQIKSADGVVSKIPAASLTAILRTTEETEYSYAGTGVMYAPMTVYGIVDVETPQDSRPVRTGIFMAGFECMISSIVHGDYINMDMAIIMSALADKNFSQAHIFAEDNDLQYSDFWGWDIPESHIEAIVRGMEAHNNANKQA
jgi:hypothetical protein